MKLASGRWAFLLLAAFSVVWVVSAWANGYAGYSLAPSTQTGTMLAIGSVAFDMAKAGLIIVAFTLYRRHRFAACTITTVLAFVCMLFSFGAALRFGGDLFLAKAVEKTHAAESLELKKERLVSVLKQLNWKPVEVKTSYKYRRDRAAAMKFQRELAADRKEMLAESERLQKEIEAERAVIKGDTVAAVLGMPSNMFASGLAILLAIALESLSAWGFWVVSEYREAHRSAPQRREPPREGFGGGGFGGHDDPPPPLEPTRSPKPAPVPQKEKNKDLIAADDVVRLVQAERGTKIKDHVMQAINKLYVQGGTEERVRWSEVRVSINKALPPRYRIRQPQAASVIMPAFKGLGWPVRKSKTGSHVWVYGIACKPSVDTANRIRSNLRVVS